MSVLVVETRNTAQTVSSLGMCCDASEAAQPLSDTKAIFWLGIARAGIKTRSGGGPDDNDWRMMADEEPISIAIAGDRIFAIVGPRSPTRPAIWISSLLSDVNATAGPPRGLIKKKPRDITLESALDDWMISVFEVGLHFRSSKRRQPGQAQSLYDAIVGGASAGS